MNERLIFNPKQLTSARIARGLTMKELAEKAELSRQMISITNQEKQFLKQIAY